MQEEVNDAPSSLRTQSKDNRKHRPNKEPLLRSSDKSTLYKGNLDELDLRNRSVKKQFVKSSLAKSKDDSLCKKMISKLRSVPKKTWIILILTTILIISLLFIARSLLNVKKQEDFFCQNGTDKVFYGDDDCEKVFTPEECQSIQVKKCMPCPENASCENGNMKCNDNYERAGNICIDELDQTTSEFVKYLHRVQETIKNKLDFTKFGSKVEQVITLEELLRNYIKEKGIEGEEEVSAKLNEFIIKLKHVYDNFLKYDLHFKKGQIAGDERLAVIKYDL